jgi:hypothetical protein
MNPDSIDGSSKPFEPETPEAFIQRGEEAFQIWWRERDSPASSRGLELDCETARGVWSAAYEHTTNCIMLVYDGAESSVDGAHPTGEMQLACVVHRHHDGTIAFPSRDFFDWAAKHENHIRQEYFEDEHDADGDTLTVWIDHSSQSPLTCGPFKRPSRASSDNLRTTADKEFARWWSRLDPPGTVNFVNLDRDEAQIVWREAFTKLWEDLEVVHDRAKAYTEVVAEKASLELAHIIDRFHNGKRSFAVGDVMRYWNDEYFLERDQTEEVICLRIRHTNRERDR